MDTGEFVAIDATEDHLRIVANSNRQRAEELAAGLLSLACNVHNKYHRKVKRTFHNCNMVSCMKARHILGIG